MSDFTASTIENEIITTVTNDDGGLPSVVENSNAVAVAHEMSEESIEQMTREMSEVVVSSSSSLKSRGIQKVMAMNTFEYLSTVCIIYTCIC
jgi:hypothetical protein